MRGRHPSNWDEFKETAQRRLPDHLHVTLNAKGEFVLSLKTLEKLNRPRAIVLLYDRATRTIGVRPSSIELPHAILIHKRHERYNCVFRSKKFLFKHGIELKRTIQFPTAQIDTDGVLILELRTAIPAITKKLK